MQVRPAHPARVAPSRLHRRQLLIQAFRQDDTPASRYTAVPQRELTPQTAVQPLWRKPSFPFVVAIALATLPLDLAYIRGRLTDCTTNGSPAGTSRGSNSAPPPRHAKPAGARLHALPAGAAPAGNVGDVEAAAAAATAAAAEMTGSLRPHQQQEQQQHAPGGGSSGRVAPQASSAATPPAASWPIFAAGGAAGPVDSWDASDAGQGFSDEEAEQQAKAMVIELLTHPKDTEEALMQAAAADPSTGGSGGRPLSVSPEYIDALVEAVKEPSIGMPHHQPNPTTEPTGPATSHSSSGNSSDTGVETATAASPSNPQPPAAAGSSQQDGVGSRRRRTPANPSLWSWLDVSPRSSQEEF